MFLRHSGRDLRNGMIVVIPRTDPESNPGEEPDWEWLPRSCPQCGGPIIGHGRRRKQAHGPSTQTIRYRRGACRRCPLTITVLPAWSLPYTHYRLETRQQSGALFLAGAPLEESAPALQDPDRSPDIRTLRRWFQRRLLSWCCWLRSSAALRLYCRPPTILAWDLAAGFRILIPEPHPG